MTALNPIPGMQSTLNFPPGFIYTFGIFELTLNQHFEVLETEYTMYTFDSSFALFGGYATLTWSIISVLISWYQDQSFNDKLSKSLYSKLSKE